MTGFVTIRGYACPFGQIAWTGHTLELVERGAFAAMINRRLAVRIQFDTHADDAPAMAHAGPGGGLFLFEDEYGLGFSAVLNMSKPDNRWRLQTIIARRKARAFASVLFVEREVVRDVLHGSRVERVTRASIDHVAIVSDAAYTGTAVWAPHCGLDDAPYRIRDLAARWETGAAAARAKNAARARSAALPAAKIAASACLRHGDRVPPTLLARFAAQRDAWARRAIKGAGVTNVVMAHAAFSKFGGFDGDFGALLNRARARERVS